jgi:putative flippase GtrA
LEPLRLPESSIGVVGNMRIVIQEALGYAAASTCALMADITVLFILVHYFSWGYLGAATASFSAGLLVGYALSVTLVFKYRRLRNRRLEFASFAAIGAGGLAINAAAISLAVKYLGLHYLIAKCGAAGFTFAWNFLARRQLLFVQRRPVEDNLRGFYR